MRGRKRSDKTRDYILHIRMNKKEMDILAYVCSKKGKDVSKVVRDLVKEEYDKLKYEEYGTFITMEDEKEEDETR